MNPPRSAERKAWFLGRYMTKSLAAFSRAKLHAQLGAASPVRGVETTLRLSEAGLAFASRGFSLRRSGGGASRLPFRPIPLHLVNDVYQVSDLSSVLVCVVRLSVPGEFNYDILPFRLPSADDAFRFQDLFRSLTLSGPAEWDPQDPAEGSPGGNPDPYSRREDQETEDRYGRNGGGGIVDEGNDDWDGGNVDRNHLRADRGLERAEASRRLSARDSMKPDRHKNFQADRNISSAGREGMTRERLPSQPSPQRESIRERLPSQPSPQRALQTTHSGRSGAVMTSSARLRHSASDVGRKYSPGETALRRASRKSQSRAQAAYLSPDDESTEANGHAGARRRAEGLTGAVWRSDATLQRRNNTASRVAFTGEGRHEVTETESSVVYVRDIGTNTTDGDQRANGGKKDGGVGARRLQRNAQPIICELFYHQAKAFLHGDVSLKDVCCQTTIIFGNDIHDMAASGEKSTYTAGAPKSSSKSGLGDSRSDSKQAPVRTAAEDSMLLNLNRANYRENRSKSMHLDSVLETEETTDTQDDVTQQRRDVTQGRRDVRSDHSSDENDERVAALLLEPAVSKKVLFDTGTVRVTVDPPQDDDEDETEPPLLTNNGRLDVEPDPVHAQPLYGVSKQDTADSGVDEDNRDVQTSTMRDRGRRLRGEDIRITAAEPSDLDYKLESSSRISSSATEKRRKKKAGSSSEVQSGRALVTIESSLDAPPRARPIRIDPRSLHVIEHDTDSINDRIGEPFAALRLQQNRRESGKEGSDFNKQDKRYATTQRDDMGEYVYGGSYAARSEGGKTGRNHGKITDRKLERALPSKGDRSEYIYGSGKGWDELGRDDVDEDEARGSRARRVQRTESARMDSETGRASVMLILSGRERERGKHGARREEDDVYARDRGGRSDGSYRGKEVSSSLDRDEYNYRDIYSRGHALRDNRAEEKLLSPRSGKFEEFDENQNERAIYRRREIYGEHAVYPRDEGPSRASHNESEIYARPRASKPQDSCVDRTSVMDDWSPRDRSRGGAAGGWSDLGGGGRPLGYASDQDDWRGSDPRRRGGAPSRLEERPMSRSVLVLDRLPASQRGGTQEQEALRTSLAIRDLEMRRKLLFAPRGGRLPQGRAYTSERDLRGGGRDSERGVVGGGRDSRSGWNE